MHQRSIVFLGASCVGKTAIICRTFGDFFPPVHVPTLRRQCYYLNLYLSSRCPYSVQLVDTSGGDCKQVCTNPELGDAFVVVFSVTDRQSFETARECLHSLAQSGSPALLIGNQVDEEGGQGRQVSTDEAERLAMECGAYDLMEMSAVDEINTRNIRGRLSDLLSFALEQEEDMTKCQKHSACRGETDPVAWKVADVDERDATMMSRPHLLLLNRPTRSEAPVKSPEELETCSPAGSEAPLCLAETPSREPPPSRPIANTTRPQTALAEKSPETSPCQQHHHAASPWRSFAHLVGKVGSGVSSRVSKALHARTKHPSTPEKTPLTKALVGHATPSHGKAKESKLSEISKPSVRVARARSFRRIREKMKDPAPSCGLIMNYQLH